MSNAVRAFFLFFFFFLAEIKRTRMAGDDRVAGHAVQVEGAKPFGVPTALVYSMKGTCRFLESAKEYHKQLQPETFLTLEAEYRALHLPALQYSCVVPAYVGTSLQYSASTRKAPAYLGLPTVPYRYRSSSRFRMVEGINWQVPKREEQKKKQKKNKEINVVDSRSYHNLKSLHISTKAQLQLAYCHP